MSNFSNLSNSLFFLRFARCHAWLRFQKNKKKEQSEEAAVLWNQRDDIVHKLENKNK